MNIKDLKQISRWQIPIFNGKLLLEGRILSVAEAETVGLASGLLLATMASPEILAAAAGAKTEQEKLQYVLQMSRQINASQLSKLNSDNDKVICKVVKRGSFDNGETWQNIIVVANEEEQNTDENKLWVGIFNEKDRQTILDKALEGHKEAVDRVAGFRK